MLQIAQSENKVDRYDRLQLAEFAGCKTKSAEEFSVISASFMLLPILLFLPQQQYKLKSQVDTHFNLP